MVEKAIHEEVEHVVDDPYQLEKLINMDEMQRVLDDFYKIAPFATAILNLKGEILLESHWEPICTRYHRVNPKTAAICTESDTHFYDELVGGNGKYILYRCGNGLCDAASPIEIGGKHVGNFFIGQFLLEPPDEDFFRKQAQRYGFPEKEYFEALSEVSIISESDLKNRLDYLCGFAEFLGNIGLKEFQRDRADKALRESEAKYRSLHESMRDAFASVDMDGNIKEFNSEYLKMVGYSEEEITKLTYMDLTPEKWHSFEEKIVKEEVLKRGHSDVYEKEYRRKDGTVFPVELRTFLIKDASGKPKNMWAIIRDINERKRTEEELYEQAQIVASIKDTILIITPEMKTIYANKTAKRLFGNRPEMFTEPCYRFFKKRGSPCENCPVLKVLEDEKPHWAIMTSFDKDGAEMWRFSTAYPYYDRNGRLIGGIEVVSDYTTQKQAEEALKTSEHRLAQIINFLPDATFVIDNEGKVIAWNQAIENMTGVKAEEILGKGDYEYAIPFYGERRPTLIDLASKWDKEIEEKYQYVKKEGESLVSETYDPLTKPGGFLRNKACLLYDSAGEVMGAIESIRDITDRKVAEEALRESEEKYRLLVENANDAIYIAQDNVLKFSNARTEELTGYSAEELNKIPFVNHIHPDDREMVIERHKKRLEGEDLVSGYPYRAINKNGEELWHLINSVPVTWEGRPATLNFVRDITEAKRLEAQLEQANKMEAIATLAGGVAHEFNNALMGVMGNIELLKMDLPKDERRDRHFGAMKDSSHRMSRLTDQLLAYAQGGKYQPRDLKLDDFVIQTLPILQHDLNSAIRVETHFQKDIAYIRADYAQMQMVLSAILANSNEAIEDEGFIRITAENKDIDEDFSKQHPGLEPGHYVCLTIEDDGKGMDEETKSGIFEPFFTTKFQGRGMAMAAVYGIVKNHDGWIYVDSELGKGTTVRIYLPATEITIEEPQKAEVEVVRGTGTILMIEDEDVVIEVTQAMLEWLGYRVMVAKTGKDAIHITETFDGRIDLALLDIKLPDMEGGKVYPLIMEARPDLKVIVFSGYAIEGPARKILDAGAQDFIQKPFSITTLSEKLKKVLEGQTTLSG